MLHLFSLHWYLQNRVLLLPLWRCLLCISLLLCFQEIHPFTSPCSFPPPVFCAFPHHAHRCMLLELRPALGQSDPKTLKIFFVFESVYGHPLPICFRASTLLSFLHDLTRKLSMVSSFKQLCSMGTDSQPTTVEEKMFDWKHAGFLFWE